MRIRKSRSTEEILARYSVSDKGCFEYQGVRNADGYAVVTGKNSMDETTGHRLAYKYFVGPIGDLHVLHKCDNPCCINPTHLFLGTHQDNMRDKTLKGRVVAHRGSAHARSKVTEADVVEIRKLKANKVPRIDIANRFGISKANVDDITTRNTWKHVI